MDEENALNEEPSHSSPFNREATPAHIAIIMDGNGRWAKERGKPRVFGHKAGAESVRRVVKACGEWDIKYLTLYAFSSENWNRPKTEVSALMRLLSGYLKAEVAELNKSNVRLNAIGDLDRLPASTRKALDRSIEQLSNNTGLTLTLALSYGGRDEIVRSARELCRKVAAGEISPDDIDEEMLAGGLDTAGMPDPDMIIRTAGEMRLSNFLLWQASYSEYYSTSLCWPDFGKDELAEAIRSLQSRTRKFGRVVE